MSLFGSGLRFDRRSKWIIAFFGYAVILQVAVLFGTVVGKLVDFHPWKEDATAKAPNYGEEQCERVNPDGFIVQGANFWSNLAYLLVGLMIYYQADTFIGKGTGIAICILFVGSAAFHGTLTEWGQFLDIIGIYMALVAIGVYGLYEIGDYNQTQPTVPLWFCWAMGMAVMAGETKNIIPWHGSTVGAALLGPALFALGIYGGWHHRENFIQWFWPAFWAITSFIVAAIFKFTDGAPLVEPPGGGEKVPQPKWLCEITGHDSLFQGHAVWHLLSAVMMLCMFEFFTSLRCKRPTVWPWRR